MKAVLALNLICKAFFLQSVIIASLEIMPHWVKSNYPPFTKAVGIITIIWLALSGIYFGLIGYIYMPKALPNLEFFIVGVVIYGYELAVIQHLKKASQNKIK